MKRRQWGLRLVAGAVSIVGLAGATAVAQAQPDPSLPIVPSIIDQLITATPALTVNQSGAGTHRSHWGDTGMICQNITVRCR